LRGLYVGEEVVRESEVIKEMKEIMGMNVGEGL
jgi:hypothetical protein